MEYTPSVFTSRISSGFIINSAAVVRVCFPPSCRMHSPPGPPWVAGQEAAHSRHAACSRSIVARPARILGCPALASGARSGQISAPKSRTAAFSCDASRTRFYRGSHSSEKKKPHFTVQTRRNALKALFLSNITTQMKMIFSDIASDYSFFLHRSACIRCVLWRFLSTTG